MPRARYGAPVVFLDLALPEPIEYFVLPTVLVVVLLTVYLLGPQASYVFLPKWIVDVFLAHFFHMRPTDVRIWCLTIYIVSGLLAIRNYHFNC